MIGPLPLYGRERALLALQAALAATRDGRGQFVLISGDAGIGKSAVATAFATGAAAEGIRVTWGRAWEFADAPPYFPVWPCLRTLGIDTGPGDGGDRQPEQRSGEQKAFQLWESVLQSLAGAAAIEPVVWIVEDLHAADLGTLDLLTFLVQPVRTMRVLIVGTTRPQDARLTERKLRRLARMTRDGNEVALPPLADADVARLAEQASGQGLPPGTVARLVELTGGNPLFVMECARAASRGGGIEAVLAAPPANVRGGLDQVHRQLCVRPSHPRHRDVI